MATGNSYTSGPWKVINGNLENRKIHQKIGPITAKSEISIQDVNLISAATDMFEALELILDDSPASVLTFHKAMDMAKKAVAKARGLT